MWNNTPDGVTWRAKKFKINFVALENCEGTYLKILSSPGIEAAVILPDSLEDHSSMEKRLPAIVGELITKRIMIIKKKSMKNKIFLYLNLMATLLSKKKNHRIFFPFLSAIFFIQITTKVHLLQFFFFLKDRIMRNKCLGKRFFLECDII